MSTDSELPRKGWIPDWGWLLSLTLSVVVLFVLVRFGLPLYWQQKVIPDLRARHVAINRVLNRGCGTCNPPDRSHELQPKHGYDWTEAFERVEILDSLYDFTDADLWRVAYFPNLRHLDLSYNVVTNSGLGNLKHLRNLQYLSLRETKVTDAGLRNLRELTNLRHLDLCHTAITDAGLTHLAGMTQLEYLWVDSTAVTNAGLKKLAHLPLLKR
jgi:hypothetical protein